MVFTHEVLNTMPVFPTGPRRLYVPCFVLYVVVMSQFPTVRAFEVTIGILGPWDAPGSYVYPLLGWRTAGAVPLALEHVRNEGILGNNTLNFEYRDTKCDTRRASGSAVDLHLFNGVHAFIGLPCSEPCRSVRDLAAYWNIPFISWFCPQTPATEAGDTYESFARTFVPFSAISSLPGAVMAQYGWTSASVVYADISPWNSLAETILATMINTGVTISNLQSYKEPLDVHDAAAILQKVKNVSHVIWLIMGGVTTLEVDEQIFMLAADQLGMTQGQQVFLRLELFPDIGHTTPWLPLLVSTNSTRDNAGASEYALRQAYEALILITYRLPQDGRIEELLRQLPETLTDPSLDFYEKINTSTPSIMSAFLYDAVLLFAYAAKQHVETNDYLAANYTRTNVTFEGMTGYVVLDNAGDRIANFSVLDLKEGQRFEAVGHVSGIVPVFEEVPGADVWWPGTVIPTEPKCGYQGQKCLESSIIIAIVAGGLITIMLAIAVPYLSLKYRKYILRKDWLIEIDELTFLPLQNSTFGVGLQGYPSTYRLPNISERLLSRQSLASETVQENLRKQSQKMAPDLSLAKYKSETVVLRRAKVSNGLTLNKATKKELKEMRWLVHDNLNRFVGVCFPTRGDNNLFYYISEYCSKGNLKNVLANDDIKLDLSFKVSFINDLARGMQFLHNSVVRSHGLLCSNLCFIDSRWALKIAGFGTVSFHMSRGTGEKITDPEVRFSKLLWTSPELLRHELPTKGSQKGDVYSFGILVEEILTRSLPYHDYGLSSREIVRKVMTRQEPPFRPRQAASEDDLTGLSTQFSQSDGVLTCLTELMMQCWAEHPEDRPDFNVIRHRLRAVQKGRKELNLMDNMVSKMEKYTENLEKVVADRTGQLLEEKKKTDALLYRMLPQAVADELKKGQSFHGEFYDQVTLYFSDIVGFTELSAMSAPMEVVDLLNDLYTCFDAILERFDVYKVETIGDAYMVASGLPNRNGNRHASEIASMALAVREGVKTFRVRHMPEHQVQIRIGINSGPVAAGVVGLTMPRFCLFGDTVNTASRMESHGLPQRIHVSWSTAALLTSIGGYRLEVRGQLRVKGKGVMTTFWLLGTDEQSSTLQLQDALQNSSVKKISTDTVISEDSLLSPPNNTDPQDFINDSLIATRVLQEIPSGFGSEGSSPSSSPRRCRKGNSNSSRSVSQLSKHVTMIESPQTPTKIKHSNAGKTQGSNNIKSKSGHIMAKTGDTKAKTRGSTNRTDHTSTSDGFPSGAADPSTESGTEDLKLEDNRSSKNDVLITKPNDIVSTSADLVVEEGCFVRTESGDIVQTPNGDIVRKPSRQQQHHLHLGSLQEDPDSLPNVPSMPDVTVQSKEPETGTKCHDSIFSYTIPLPQLMNEISSTLIDSSVNAVESNQQNTSS